MCTATDGPASMAEALAMVRSGLGFLAGMDTAGLPAEALGGLLVALERADAVEAAVRGEALAAYDAQGGPVGDGQRTTKAWLVHTSKVTRRQAAEHLAVRRIAEDHPVLHAALADGDVLAKSIALEVVKWTAKIPDEYRDEAEEIVVAAARAGADLRALATICAEIRARVAPPDPDDPDDPDPGPERGVSLETTMDGAGVLRGELTPECSAMVEAVLDALAAPQPGGESRTRRQRYHDALAEAMRRLLASDLLPKRAGQPVKALAHIHFSELVKLDRNSAFQTKWIEGYRAGWAARRAAAAVSTGDGGAWLEGDAAQAVACDAMIIPVVTADIDLAAIEALITACAEYHRIRAQAAAQPHDAAQPGDTAGQQDAARPDESAARPDESAARPDETASRQDGADAPEARDSSQTQPGPDGGTAAAEPGSVAAVLAMLEHQILAAVIQVVSGPGGVASFLRRNLLGKGLNGPSLPLDVGQTDEIPVHLRRLVALRDQRCQHPGGCDQPAGACEPHHVVHRADGGHTSLTNLKDYCWWHHHVLLHELGWKLTVHPDGTSQVTSPAGKIIRSHSPPPRPG
jgi:Domain of unknown function (DUF222)